MKFILNILLNMFMHRGPYCWWIGLRLNDWDFFPILRLNRFRGHIIHIDGHMIIRADRGGFFFPTKIGWFGKMCLPLPWVHSEALRILTIIGTTNAPISGGKSADRMVRERRIHELFSC